MATDKTNQTIKLQDGRMLGYDEYGNPEGKPVFCLPPSYRGSYGRQLGKGQPKTDDSAGRLKDNISCQGYCGVQIAATLM